MAVVIKLGGSLFRNVSKLKNVCGALSTFSQPIVLVPGGGVFGDCVREAQTQFAFDDETAHLMAILAMEQNGYLLSSLNARFEPTSHLDQFPAVWSFERIPVWMPFLECEHDNELARNWSVSSDSIAARLAERMEGGSVVLLKSCVVDPSWNLEQLAERGVVDQTFGHMVKRGGLRYRVLGTEELSLLSQVVFDFEEGST